LKAARRGPRTLREDFSRVLSLTDLKPGDTLGRYEILMPVAHGGMAAVWAARMVGSRGFQKLVAVKTMLPSLSDDPDFETMFLDEARLASRIHHPHVVEIIDLGDEHGWLYLVMEWVDGETIFTLNKRAKAKGGIPLPLLLRITSSACAGLHAAHELRDEKTGRLLDLVHRDISPQNVMISSNGIVKIVDFGVAKAAGRVHNTVVKGMMKGKVPYGSPEQLSGAKVDRRSDIFSLGILMYVMLSGLHPFRGESDQKTMENICHRKPVPLAELVPGVPADVEAIVTRALEKDPDGRFPDCSAMQRAIDAALSALGETVTDGDVAAFVKSVVGDLSDDRRAKLATAIEQADNAAGTTGRDGPASRHGDGARSVRSGGTGLPATFKGIIPVSLDDPPPLPKQQSSAPKPKPKPAPASTPTPSPASSPAPVAPPVRARRSVVPHILLGLIIVVSMLAIGVRLGMLPWVADRLPLPVRNLILPRASSVAPPSAPSAPAAPDTGASAPPAAPAPPPDTAASGAPPSAAPTDPTAPSAATADAAAPSGAPPVAPSAPSGAPPSGAAPRPQTDPNAPRKLLENPYE
jgi:serine/threonine-protein kinase